MLRKIIVIGAFVIALLWIKNSIVASYSLWHKQDLVTKAQKELDAEKLKNKQFKQQLSMVQSNYFIEEEARNKLLLAKPTEKDVLIDRKLLPVDQAKKNVTTELPHWQEWYNLFFGDVLEN